MMYENDSDNPVLDNEVADLTDAVLAGRTINPSETAQALIPVVRSLQDLSAPAQPDATFRARLTQRLNTEFDNQRRSSQPRTVSFNRYRPLLAAAAVLVLVSLAALVGGRMILTGTAQGQDSAANGIVLVIFVVVLAIIGVVLWWRERK